jgi:uncharacterized protein YkwD
MRPREPLALLALAASALFLAVPVPAQARVNHAKLDDYERKLVRLINDARAAQGMGVLRVNRRLGRSADRHSHDMLARDFFTHDSSDGMSFARRVRRYLPAARVGEVQAYAERGAQRPDPRIFLDVWQGSAEHRGLLFEPGFRRIGLACRGGVLGRVRALVCTADLASRH